MWSLLISVILACAPLVGAPAEESPCEERAMLARQQNSDRMQGTLELDRTEYIPGEVMAISVSLRNNSGQALEVFDPWRRGGLFLRLVNDRDEEANHPEHPKGRAVLPPEGGGHWLGWHCSGTGVVVQPGAALARRIRTGQPMVWQPALMPILSAPDSPGDYLLEARYGGLTLSQPFRVLPVLVESHTELRLRAAPDGRPVKAFVIGCAGKRYVVIEARANAFPTIRVAELEPDESLDGLEEGRDGRITARIRSGSGRFRLADRPEPDEAPQ
jgi:hypothetical protein